MKQLKVKLKPEPLPNQQLNEPENEEAAYWRAMYDEEVHFRKIEFTSRQNLFKDYCDMKNWRNAFATLCFIEMLAIFVIAMLFVGAKTGVI